MAEPMTPHAAATMLRIAASDPHERAPTIYREIADLIDRLTATIATVTAAREAAERVADEAEEDSENSLRDLETAIAERKTAEASLAAQAAWVEALEAAFKLAASCPGSTQFATTAAPLDDRVREALRAARATLDAPLVESHHLVHECRQDDLRQALAVLPPGMLEESS